jgi:uncharacterized alpha/beta hydrolase family protein
MKQLLIVVVLLAVVVAGLGFYLGWFDVTVDKDKFQQDTNRVLGR